LACVGYAALVLVTLRANVHAEAARRAAEHRELVDEIAAARIALVGQSQTIVELVVGLRLAPPAPSPAVGRSAPSERVPEDPDPDAEDTIAIDRTQLSSRPGGAS
jgi:hypothetical protein